MAAILKAARLIPLLWASCASAQTSGISIDLGPGDGDRRTVKYTCEGFDPITLTYLDVAPNYLALMPIEGQTYVLATVASATGTRYVSGQWVWTVSGQEATLADVTRGAKAPPVANCLEANDTP